eukprot:3242630-Ditylum_brightwellii.AAC.1
MGLTDIIVTKETHTLVQHEVDQLTSESKCNKLVYHKQQCQCKISLFTPHSACTQMAQSNRPLNTTPHYKHILFLHVVASMYQDDHAMPTWRITYTIKVWQSNRSLNITPHYKHILVLHDVTCSMEKQSHHCNTRAMRQKTSSGELKNCDDGNQSWLSQTALSASCLTQGGGAMTAVMVEFRAVHHILLILPCACLMGNVATAAMVEFRASHHRLLILPHAYLMGNVMTAIM